ncbi:MAG: ABC transporter ATP-binding protein [Acidimicrobiales bacterium]|nr:MAG: ABC transporter ATP-binding protein [Acidimicrobiales bacterium]
MQTGRAVIETRHLTKAFPGVVAVDDLDLTIRAGEIFGFLGPNGAGKSTTIRMLLDLARPTSGRVEVFGLDPRVAAAAILRRVGYVPSEPAFSDQLTGRRFLREADALRGLDSSATREVMAERLDAELDRRIRELSTGNRQKIALLHALAHEPELIVLDEPTRGLDPLVQHTFHEMLREAARHGATVFLSSHSLAEVDRVADRVGVIREGRLVAVDTLAGLKERATTTIDLELASAPDVDRFRRLDGVRGAEADGTHLRVVVQGSVDALLRAALDDTEIHAVRSAAADLEDVFLDFYRAEDVEVEP